MPDAVVVRSSLFGFIASVCSARYSHNSKGTNDVYTWHRAIYFLFKKQFLERGCSIGADWITFKALSIIEIQEGEIIIETNYKPVILGVKHEIFFEEDMIIDYSKQRNTFTLKSKNEILQPYMQLR